MAKVLRIAGKIWMALLALIVVVCGLAIIFTEGIWMFWQIYSPFNILNWVLIFILGLPGFGLVKLADRLDKKQTP